MKDTGPHVGDLATIVVDGRCVHALVYRIYVGGVMELIIDNETCADLAIPSGSWVSLTKKDLVRWKSLGIAVKILTNDTGMIRIYL